MDNEEKITKSKYITHLENTLGKEAPSIQPDIEKSTVTGLETTLPKFDPFDIVNAARLSDVLRATPTFTTKIEPQYHTDDLLEELGHHLAEINTKIDTLINEKSNLLEVLKEIGMCLTILYNRDIETPCISFEGTQVHIKLTIEQYAKLVSLGVPVV